MSRLIVSVDGVVVKEVLLTKDRSTIGRRPYNDVVIDHLAVSGEHAVVHLAGDQATVEDLGSTNGTYVNGRGIKRQVLKYGDTIEVGKARIKFAEGDMVSVPAGLADSLVQAEGASAVGGAEEAAPILPTELSPLSGGTGPRVRVLSGAATGREMPLVKVVTTIGKPGRSVAAIVHKPHGFDLSHVEGDPVATVNGLSVEDGPIALKNHDQIELSGIRLEFIDGTDG